jgi:hypothetical protein
MNRLYLLQIWKDIFDDYWNVQQAGKLQDVLQYWRLSSNLAKKYSDGL